MVDLIASLAHMNAEKVKAMQDIVLIGNTHFITNMWIKAKYAIFIDRQLMFVVQ